MLFYKFYNIESKSDIFDCLISYEVTDNDLNTFPAKFAPTLRR